MTRDPAPRPPALVLASRSPRRRELLLQMGLAFTVTDVAIDEALRPGEAPHDYVLRLAGEKALAARAGVDASRTVVLAADTTVVLDGRILGKPVDDSDAVDMLAALSAREHRVLTGIAVATPAGCERALSESRVRLRATTPRERAAYAATGEPLDKAGGYAIQGRAAIFVEHLDGSYSGVMGLPVFETARLLQAAGVAVLG